MVVLVALTILKLIRRFLWLSSDKVDLPNIDRYNRKTQNTTNTRRFEAALIVKDRQSVNDKRWKKRRWTHLSYAHSHYLKKRGQNISFRFPKRLACYLPYSHSQFQGTLRIRERDHCPTGQYQGRDQVAFPSQSDTGSQIHRIQRRHTRHSQG